MMYGDEMCSRHLPWAESTLRTSRMRWHGTSAVTLELVVIHRRILYIHYSYIVTPLEPTQLDCAVPNPPSTPSIMSELSNNLGSNNAAAGDTAEATQFCVTFSSTADGFARVVGQPVKMYFKPRGDYIWRKSPVIASDLSRGVGELASQWKSLLSETELKFHTSNGGSDTGTGLVFSETDWSNAINAAIKTAERRMTKTLKEKVPGCIGRTRNDDNRFMGYTSTELGSMADRESWALAPYAEVKRSKSDKDQEVTSIIVGTVAVANSEASGAEQASWYQSDDRATELGRSTLHRSLAGKAKDKLLSLTQSLRSSEGNASSDYERLGDD